jgi:negative regulator of sigma-B (phosphoserine phosphatase)
MRADGRLGPLEWAVTARPIDGEELCGDHWVVADTGDGALLGVIDGLGHGRHAALAAHRAAEVLAENPAEPLDVLVLLCHRALLDTRGAAITLALVSFGDPGLRWLGVGNVAACLVRGGPGIPAPVGAPLHGGIVGYRLPAGLDAQDSPLQAGDVLLLGTDGLRGDFADDIAPLRAPGRLADDILTRSARGTDDALILVARYRGGSI